MLKETIVAALMMVSLVPAAEAQIPEAKFAEINANAKQIKIVKATNEFGQEVKVQRAYYQINTFDPAGYITNAENGPKCVIRSISGRIGEGIPEKVILGMKAPDGTMFRYECPVSSYWTTMGLYEYEAVIENPPEGTVVGMLCKCAGFVERPVKLNPAALDKMKVFMDAVRTQLNNPA